MPNDLLDHGADLMIVGRAHRMVVFQHDRGKLLDSLGKASDGFTLGGEFFAEIAALLLERGQEALSGLSHFRVVLALEGGLVRCVELDDAVADGAWSDKVRGRRRV